MRRWRLVAAAAVAVLVVLAAVLAMTRGISWRGRVPVVAAELREDDRLVLVVNTCGGEPKLDLLRESVQQVDVAVVATHTVVGPGEDCQDLVEVRLAEPFGDRRLVDLTSGEEVNVQR